ncbi:integrin-linked kinase-associated serine/threonine phosphatase 2C-like [Oscarella lobularis]|uniref:integrin-linked kinase-associated serine/threonine phosphatase 2C-like n=1 Tax=Oscarella lobularis TaxID=121494 RepID=UPI0033144366
MDLFGDLPPPIVSSPKNNCPDDKAPDAKKFKVSVLYDLIGCVGERRGEREEMQDAHQILENITSQFPDLSPQIPRVAYFGLFDGHAGFRASQHAAENLHKNIIAKFPKGEISNQDREIRRCIVDAFKQTDEEFLQKASAVKPVWKDGSTAVCILVVNDTLYVANLGDSKALVATNDDKDTIVAKRLTKDHNPIQYEERQRIQKAGGVVREGRVSGILEVSRSIGDGRFKHCGVTCIPDIVKHQLSEKDKFILLACDGLFKAFTADTAVKRINEMLEDKDLPFPAHMKNEDYVPLDDRAAQHEAACNLLAAEAVRKFSADNVTVILIDIRLKNEEKDKDKDKYTIN